MEGGPEHGGEGCWVAGSINGTTHGTQNVGDNQAKNIVSSVYSFQCRRSRQSFPTLKTLFQFLIGRLKVRLNRSDCIATGFVEFRIGHRSLQFCLT